MSAKWKSVHALCIPIRIVEGYCSVLDQGPLGSEVESGPCSSCWVEPVGEAQLIMASQVGSGGDHWIKVLDLELQG